MPIYRINKKTNFTTIDNGVFKDTELSFKATGLLVTMLSLPDSWDFSETGLCKLKTDNKKSIKSGLKELEEHGYLVRSRVRDSKGRLKETLYDIYEEPKCLFQTLDNQTLEKETQLNTKDNKELNNNQKEIIKERKRDIEHIVGYLNLTLDTKYRSTSAFVKHINARLDEGYSVDDFYNVIENKYEEWHGTDMEKYLRPDTLFGTKFDIYLNQKK